jgi:hypothetical protein
VRAGGLADAGPAGDPAHNPSGAVPVQPAPAGGAEDRSFAAPADGQVDRAGGPRCERDGDDLAALAGDDQGPVPALDAQRLNAGGGSFADPQAVECQQRDERLLGRRPEPGGDQQRAKLVSV